MDRVEFYSGESTGSPDLFSDPSDMSGQFAINARDIYGNQQPSYQYSPYQQYYQPQQNFMNPPQQPMQFNTGFGYNQTPMFSNYQQPQFGAPMNNPMFPPNNSGYQMGLQTLDPSKMNTGFVGNPAIQMLNQWEQQGTPYTGSNGNGYYDPINQRVVFTQQPQSTQDRVVNVPGYNPGGSIGMLTSDAQEICEQMQVDMMYEQQQVLARRQQRSQGVFNSNQYGYMNYYGSPFVNNYMDNSVYNKYMDKLNEMKQEAIDRRIRFNKRLSMICHNYLNDGITEADINRIYDGYSYTIPGTSVQDYQTQERLYRMVPVSNAAAYQQHSAQVTALYQMIAPPGHNMNEFFADAGMFKIVDNLEQEFHRRRNTQNYFGEDIYHEFMRKYAREHDLEEQQYLRDRETTNKITELAMSKNGEVTKEDIYNVLYSPEKVQEMRNNGFIINPDGTTEWRLDESPILKSIQQKQQINSENEIDYEMRRSAFIASVYDNNRSQVGG